MKNLYSNLYSRDYKDNATKHVNEAWIQIVKKKLPISYNPKNKILDIACGISALGSHFGDTIYGFDLNEEAIKVAKKNGIIAMKADAEKPWKYPDNYFDIVIASHIIEHMVNPDHLMKEAKRVLKKNGLLLVATPNLAAWFNRILLLCGVQPFFTEVSSIDKTLGLQFTRKLTPLRDPLGHLRVFTLGALKDIFVLHQFSLTMVCGNEFLALPISLLMVDKFFSHFPSLASNIIIVGKKN